MEPEKALRRISHEKNLRQVFIRHVLYTAHKDANRWRCDNCQNEFDRSGNYSTVLTTVKLLLAAATILFETLLLRLLFEGGYYLRAAIITELKKKIREIALKMNVFYLNYVKSW